MTPSAEGMEEGPEEMEAGGEAKLCSLYGSESRFVNFTNGTGLDGGQVLPTLHHESPLFQTVPN